MNKTIKTFNKLIDAKEKEKQGILSHYNHLKNKFEEVSNTLYELVKKEENAKSHLNKLIEEGDISRIQQQTRFIQHLEPLIQKQESHYAQAKDELHIEKLKLTQKNVEMKKIEKVKEKKIEEQIQLEKTKESKDMDEISINQFTKSWVMA